MQYWTISCQVILYPPGKTTKLYIKLNSNTVILNCGAERKLGPIGKAKNKMIHTKCSLKCCCAIIYGCTTSAALIGLGLPRRLCVRLDPRTGRCAISFILLRRQLALAAVPKS